MTSKCSYLCEHQRRSFCFAAFSLQNQTLRSLYLMGTLGAGGSALSGHHLSLRSEPSQTKATHKRNLHFVKLAHTSKDAVKVPLLTSVYTWRVVQCILGTLTQTFYVVWITTFRQLLNANKTRNMSWCIAANNCFWLYFYCAKALTAVNEVHYINIASFNKTKHNHTGVWPLVSGPWLLWVMRELHNLELRG